jgi:hypothetical protein
MITFTVPQLILASIELFTLGALLMALTVILYDDYRNHRSNKERNKK